MDGQMDTFGRLGALDEEESDLHGAGSRGGGCGVAGLSQTAMAPVPSEPGVE